MQQRKCSFWRSWIVVIGVLVAACGAPEAADRGSSLPPPGTRQPTAVQPPAPTIAPTATPFSPWRGQIAYVHDGNIWLLDLVTGATTQLTDDGASGAPAWSPDGAWIVFATEQSNNSQIVRMRADGSERTQLTSSESLKLFPAYAPDGAIHFIRRAPGDTPPIEVVRLHADGSETVVHAEPGGLCGPTNLSVGSENAIALSLGCGMGSYMFVITPGAEPIDVGNAIDGAICAADGEWAHRPSRLLVKTAVECAYQQGSSLTAVDLASTPLQPTELFTGQRIGGFGWSSDDRAIAFSTYLPDSGASGGLWIVNTTGGEAQRVLDVGSSPAWRP